MFYLERRTRFVPRAVSDVSFIFSDCDRKYRGMAECVLFSENVAGAWMELKVKIERRGLTRDQYRDEYRVTLPDAIFF